MNEPEATDLSIPPCISPDGGVPAALIGSLPAGQGTSSSASRDRLRHVTFTGARPPGRVSHPRTSADTVQDPPDGTGSPEDAFLRGLLDSAGLPGICYRLKPLRRRLATCLRRLGTSDPAVARIRIDGDEDRLEEAVQILLIGTTEFFRDPPLFPRIHQHVLPSLRATGRPPRVWSAGCSDGSELYSMAILLEEGGSLERARLLGTDCRLRAVQQARQGIFPEASLRNLDSATRRRYFRDRGRGWEIDSRFRLRTSWRVVDLLRQEPISERDWDLILCRNLAMYLEPAAIRSLWMRLGAALRPGGFLVTGRAERAPQESFEPIATSIFRRR